MWAVLSVVAWFWSVYLLMYNYIKKDIMGLAVGMGVCFLIDLVCVNVFFKKKCRFRKVWHKFDRK